jgi:tetratricopeptide (TPR) repeat protein
VIQPVKSSKTTWFVYWVDLEEPVPGVGTDYFLPTLLIICDAAGTPLAAPEILEELDQARVENFLVRLFDRLGPPDRLAVCQSEDWDEEAWKMFSEEHQVDIRFQRFDNDVPAAFRALTRTVVLRFSKESTELPERNDIASGLVNTALRVRSAQKKMALLRLALEHDPDCAAARVELADADFQRGNWKNCLAAYDELISREMPRWHGLAPNWWAELETRPVLRAFYGRGMTLWHQGHHGHAAEQFENLLELNKRDNQGVRFFIPLLRLLAEEPESAAGFFERYEKDYAGDYTEPSFSFGWALTLSLCGMEAEAKAKYREGILKNLYIAPMLLEDAETVRNSWHPNDRAEPNYAAEFIDSYAVLWDREPGALRLLRETWQELSPHIAEIHALRARMLDFQDQRFEPNYKKLWQELVEADEKLTAASNF